MVMGFLTIVEDTGVHNTLAGLLAGKEGGGGVVTEFLTTVVDIVSTPSPWLAGLFVRWRNEDGGCGMHELYCLLWWTLLSSHCSWSLENREVKMEVIGCTSCFA